MSKILRVNMSDLKVSLEDSPQELERLGGRGLSAHIIYSEVPATCHPLSKHNKIIFAPGLLAGSAAPNSGRLSVGAKSPLTGGTKEANSGGTVAHKLGHLGIKAIIVEGESNNGSLHVLKVSREGVTILPAPELKGLLNYPTTEKLRQAHGDSVGIICTGPAGEMKLAAASVACTDTKGRPARHAARGGLGAVMAAKGLKAIVVDDAGTTVLPAKNGAAFAKTFRALTKEILERKGTPLLSQFGTVGGLFWISMLGSLPTRNFTAGSFENDAAIGSKTVAQTNAARGGSFGQVCMPGCVIRCSNVIHDKDGNYLTSGFEYESSAMLGSNLGISDIDVILAMERRCDDLGLDTIETGVAIGVAADAGIFTFGDGQQALALLDEIGKGTVLGRVLGQGGEVTARVFGISRVPAVKGQGIPAHDPRVELGSGISYITSPQGADHTGVTIFKANNVEEMVERSRKQQLISTACDALGLCRQVDPSFEVMAQLLNGFYGWSWSAQDVIELAKAVLKEEIAFNRSAGLSHETDRLPDFMREEPLPPSGGVFNVPDNIADRVLNF